MPKAAGLFIAPHTTDLQHPVMARFRPLDRAVPWNSFPVWRHWALTELRSGKAVNVVFSYSDGQPAARWSGSSAGGGC